MTFELRHRTYAHTRMLRVLYCLWSLCPVTFRDLSEFDHGSLKVFCVSLWNDIICCPFNLGSALPGRCRIDTTFDSLAQCELEVWDGLLERRLGLLFARLAGLRLVCFVAQLFQDVYLRVKHFLPVTVDSRQARRGLLEDSIDNVHAFAELSLSTRHFKLQLFDVLVFLSVLSPLIFHILSDDFNAALYDSNQIN